MHQGIGEASPQRARQRRRQRLYAARLKRGIAVYPVALGEREISALCDLGWLQERDADDRHAVGQAVTMVVREIAKIP